MQIDNPDVQFKVFNGGFDNLDKKINDLTQANVVLGVECIAHGNRSADVLVAYVPRDKYTPPTSVGTDRPARLGLSDVMEKRLG